MRTHLTGLSHLFNCNPSFRLNAHNLGGNAQCLVSIEENHSGYRVVYFTDDRIILFTQFVGDPVEITYRYPESHVLCVTCRTLGEVVM